MKKTILLLVALITLGFSATHYVDVGLATGDNDGTSAENAWQHPESTQVAGYVSVGDTVLLKTGTYTQTAAFQLANNAGTALGGYIRYIGVDSEWAVDRDVFFVFDGDGAAASCLDIDVDYFTFENIRFTGANGHNVDMTANDADHILFINCVSDSAGNSGDGWACGNTGGCAGIWYYCLARDNEGSGISDAASGALIAFSVFLQNGAGGISLGYSDYIVIFGCLIHDNGNSTIIGTFDSGHRILFNVIDGTNQEGETGISAGAPNNADNWSVIGNRITNCAVGIDANSSVGLVAGNYFGANTEDSSNVSLIVEAPGIMDNHWGQAADGYVDDANHDFNIVAGDIARRIALTLRTTVPE